MDPASLGPDLARGALTYAGLLVSLGLREAGRILLQRRAHRRAALARALTAGTAGQAGSPPAPGPRQDPATTAQSPGAPAPRPFLRFFDPIGTLAAPLAMVLLPLLLAGEAGLALFGWFRAWPARGTHVDALPREARAQLALAGPFLHLLFAVLAAFLLAVFDQPPAATAFGVLVIVNAALFVFSLLPVPPLDGFRILALAANLDPRKCARSLRWSWVVLLGLCLLPQSAQLLLGALAFPLADFLANAAASLIGG